MIPKECPLRRREFDGWPTISAKVRLRNAGNREAHGLLCGNVHTDLPVEEQLKRLRPTREEIRRTCLQCEIPNCHPHMANMGRFVSKVVVVNPEREDEEIALRKTFSHPTNQLEKIK